MKITVSIPDDLFKLAEIAARRLRVSSSQFYAKALAEYLNRQRTADTITKSLNAFYSHHDAKVDSLLNAAQLDSVAPET